MQEGEEKRRDKMSRKDERARIVSFFLKSLESRVQGLGFLLLSAVEKIMSLHNAP